MLLSDMFSPFYLFGLLTLAKLSNGQAGVCSQTALNTCTAGTGTNCYRLLAGVGIGALPAVEVIPFCNIYTQAAYVGAAALPAAVLAVCGTTTTRISSISVTSTTTRATSPITTIPISTSSIRVPSTPTSSCAQQTTLIPAAFHTCGTSTNCYHGLVDDFAVADVVSFCRTYTAAVYTDVTGLPASILNSCSTTTTRISSLCSCLVSKGDCVPTATSALATRSTSSCVATPPAPTAPGTTTDCCEYYVVKQGDTCANKFGVFKFAGWLRVLYTKFCSVKFSEAKFILETFAPHVQRPTVDKLTDSRIVVKSQDKYSGR
ncbi:unnamed protein product [Diplocarpon coronariae]|nr:hypothetical protein JHW43_007029 [Diplocarpon mali]